MNQQIFVLKFTLKWLLVAMIVGLAIGSASAFFLVTLDWTTHYRENHPWLIWLLPLGGLAVGSIYHYFGQDVAKGNNQLIEEIQHPDKIIPFKMMPLIYITTIITHFVGGSAGREGTAVQMGGAIADSLTKPLKLNDNDRKILLMMGVSAGFASVFGTPLAGTIFALEVAFIGKIRYDALVPSLFAALLADYTCQELWHVRHTHYPILSGPHLAILPIVWSMLAGILFGLVGMLFAKSTHFWSNVFKANISYPPLRPVIGGVLLALCFWLVGTSKYNGLGVPVIVASFTEKLPFYDFLAKIFFTSLTLGSGFKGGEVTPLFYIGATMGNALTSFIPLPLALLAGMGFVGVFAGASNTPIACTLMGIELFGAQSAIYLAIACIMAYAFSGHSGIYTAQKIGVNKYKVPNEEFL